MYYDFYRWIHYKVLIINNLYLFNKSLTDCETQAVRQETKEV
jgi:hypothetical protein